MLHFAAFHPALCFLGTIKFLSSEVVVWYSFRKPKTQADACPPLFLNYAFPTQEI
jgi:hypothetical protein